MLMTLCRNFVSSLYLKGIRNREYIDSVVVYEKYVTRLGELIIFKPWRENYHFSQPSSIFLIYDSTMYVFYLSFNICFVEFYFLKPTNMNLAVYGNGLSVVMNNVDCIIKRDVCPQKMHLCSKNIRGISVFVIKTFMVYQTKYIIGVIAWLFRYLIHKMEYSRLRIWLSCHIRENS